jgi:hypothetical protein
VIFLKPQPVELDDLSEEAKVALFREIGQFIQAGGVLTEELWVKMEPAERAIYVFVAKGGAEKELATLNAMADKIEARAAGDAP